MYKFDFLSSSPRNFIFQKNTNKTNFGGFLSVIYFIIFLIVSIYYLLSYYNEDNYSIQYLFHEKILSFEEYYERIQSNKYNPNFLFDVFLDINTKEEYINRFHIIDRIATTRNYYINQTEAKKRNISEIDWMIVFECDRIDRECSLNKNITNASSISLYMQYNGFILDHQKRTAQLYREDNDISHVLNLTFSFRRPTYMIYKWNNIKYREEKELFSIFKNEDENEYIGLTIKSIDTSIISLNESDSNLFSYVFDFKNFRMHKYRILGQIKFIIDFNHYDEYRRTSKSFWDAIANICSLNMVLLNGFSIIIGNFYSNDYNNYKIMEKIFFNLNNQRENNEKKIIEKIEIHNDSNITDNLISNSNKENNIMISDEGAINDDNNELLEDNNIIEENYNLPELNFCDFIFNNIHDNKCCCKINRQNIIHKCNEIISKYYSIEYILYYQIKIENLLKDYRWNDPRLNIFESNELISQLKENISSFNFN